MAEYLLDTNIISELMRIAPNDQVYGKWSRHENTCAIATITWHELIFGVKRMPESRRKIQYEAFLAEFKKKMLILPYTIIEAQWHATERARLMNIGKPSAYADGQIAAIAACNNLIMVTGNTQDFASFYQLKLENWF